MVVFRVKLAGSGCRAAVPVATVHEERSYRCRGCLDKRFCPSSVLARADFRAGTETGTRRGRATLPHLLAVVAYR